MVKIKVDDCDNWSDDVLKMPAIKWIEKEIPKAGFEFAGTFRGYAEDNGLSCVLITFPVNKPEECVVDQANCSRKNALKAINLIKGEN